MKPGNVSIYYNPEWGYIIASGTTMKDTIIGVVVDPVDTKKADVSEQELGEAVLAGLEKSRAALPVEREQVEKFHFWHVTGIRNFAAFSKKFQCVEAEEEKKALKLVRLKRESDGSYVRIKNDAGIEVPVSSLPKRIGQLVCYLFQQEEESSPKDGEKAAFLSINQNRVEYSLPSEDFIDAGDGHTDAYQIYRSEKDEGSYIAFFIDNGYSKISRRGIKKRWKQIYGRMKEYHFEWKEEGLLRAAASAKADKSNINAYFYQDGEDLLEILTEISNNIAEEQQMEIGKEMKRIVESVSIT